MPSFSVSSLNRLETCDVRLQRLFRRVVEDFDCTVVSGHRGKEEQNELVAAAKSQLVYPKSLHNAQPSWAVDVAPYYRSIGIVWNHPDERVVRENATLFAGYVMGVAAGMGIGIRWGGDWNENRDTADNNFDDFWHFELI